jgi:hypothetical protein
MVSMLALNVEAYMPTLKRLKAVGEGLGLPPPQKIFFSEGCKMVYSAAFCAFWI